MLCRDLPQTPSFFGASEVAGLRLLPADRYASAVHAVLSRNTGTHVMNTGHCSEGGEDGGIIERTERERERGGKG